MTRAILVPADLSGAALTDLKAWLGVTTAQDNASLVQLLRAGLDLCEGFCGQLPLASTCEERVLASSCWQDLRTRPVHAITKVESLAVSGRAACWPLQATPLISDPKAQARCA